MLATSTLQTPSLTTPTPSWKARLELEFARGPHGSLLSKRMHHGPLRVQKALYPEGEEICHAIIIHPPAGIAGGDVLDIDVHLHQASHAVLSTPSATKWYKSAGNPATQSVHFRLDARAKLDWLPQENLFFNASFAELNTTFDLEPGASFIAWDAFMLGRKASAEEWKNGSVKTDTRIKIGGQLIWLEKGCLDAQNNWVNSLPQMGGWPIVSTLLAVGSNCSAQVAEQLAQFMPWTDRLRAGITYLQQGVLVARIVSSDMELTRALQIEIWSKLRPLVHGVEAQPLRLWAS